MVGGRRERGRKAARGVHRHLLVGLGFASLGVGAAGVILPLLPATPFLVFAAYCFFRGSERWHRWLLNNRCVGGYVRNWVEHQGMTRRSKVVALLMLWASLAVSAWVVGSMVMALVLLGVGVCCSIVIVRLRTVPLDATSAGDGSDEKRRE